MSQSATSALEQVLDSFTVSGGLVLKRFKSQRPNKFSGHDIFYSFPTNQGTEFKTAIYSCEDKDSEEVVPFICVLIRLGHLSSARDVNSLLQSIADQNFQIYDPLKLCTDDGVVTLSLRCRADKVSTDYIEELLPFALWFGEQYLKMAHEKFGLKPLLTPDHSNTSGMH